MSKAEYTIVLESPNGEHTEIDFYQGLNFGYTLNSGSTASLSLPAMSPKLTPENTATQNSHLRVYRKASPTVKKKLVWYGKMVRPSINKSGSGATLTMTYHDLFSQLGNLRTGSDYEQTTADDAGDICWDVINTAQLRTGGSLGITRGASPASADRIPLTELADRTLKEIIESYSSMENGFDFEITPTPKVKDIGIFNVYYNGDSATYHKGNVQGIELVYREGSTRNNYANNVKSFGLIEEGEKLTTFMRMTGATIEDTGIQTEITEATSLGIYGLFEDSITNNDIQTLADLEARATEEVRTRSSIPLQLTLEMLENEQPEFGTYDVGDIFVVDFEYYTLRKFKAQMRLYEINVQVQNGVESVSLSLNTI